MTNNQNLQLNAYAKINLGLDVVRRLENGYHEVKMIMQTVNIFDTLFFEKTESGIQLMVDNSEIPSDENNLVVKATRLMFDTYKLTGGVKIFLKKRIPIAAGMAGGSTDAAAALKGINQLFEINATDEELKEIAVKLGADVPYCIMGTTALSEGIGERLTKLPSPPKCYVLVAKPDIFVSTKFVYENLKLNQIKIHPDIDGMIENIKLGNLKEITNRMENVLETVTIKEYPVIENIKDLMKQKGALNALMSGSGPTVFGIYDSKELIEEAYEKLKQEGIAKQIFITEWKENVYE